MTRKRYENLDRVDNRKSFADLRRWQAERRRKIKDLSYVVPSVPVDWKAALGEEGEPAVTWIGHSTFLIRIAGLNVVTDPVWAKTMGFSARLAPPGIPIDQMPPIDVVLISHAHYDHLHIASLRRLKGTPLLLVPDGLSRMLKRKGFSRVEEFAWWTGKRVGRAEFVFVPAQHWTRRGLFDMNTSHWGGWIIREVKAGQQQNEAEPAGRTIYFAGDSGYFRGFREIGRRYDIDCALMPIGAYEPEWFMGPQHVTPEEAVQAFVDVGARLFVPMHYGAFRLADDTPKEALDRLHEEWKRRGLEPDRLKTLLHGESLAIREAGQVRRTERTGETAPTKETARPEKTERPVGTMQALGPGQVRGAGQALGPK